MALTMVVGCGGVILYLMTPRSKAEVVASSASGLGRWIKVSHFPDGDSEARETGDCVTRMSCSQKQCPSTSVSDYLS